MPGEKRYRFSWEETGPDCDSELRAANSRRNPIHLAREWQALMDQRRESKADLAGRLGVSRARVTQVLQVLDLAPGALELLERLSGPQVVSERALRSLRRLSPAAQREGLTELLAGHGSRNGRSRGRLGMGLVGGL